MASRPFNTSAKEPMSVKLRALNPSKNVTRQLEIDSRRMEERLRELKVAMNREKQERERQGSAGSGGIWSSAQQGNDVMKKKNPSKPNKPGENKVRKIKVLKDTPLEVPKRAVKKSPATLNSVRKSFSGPPCGQCEERPVALTCMECGENYCAGCFAKFHLKGALRQHRSIPFQSGSQENSPNNSMEANSDSRPEAKMKPSVPKMSSGADSHSNQQGKVIIAKTTPPKDPSPQTGNSIFDGEYNEEESAASFAAALAEWRQAKKGGQQNGIGGQGAKKDVHDMGSGTTAGLDDDKKPVEISFHDNPSLSYADRLLLKKHRRTELPSALSPTPSQLANHYLPRETDSTMGDGDLPNGHNDRSEEELEMEEEHQRYANIFVKESPREGMERPKSNLTIMEISEDDATVEKDLEVQSVYSVQEWDSVINAPSPHVMVMTPDNNNTEIKPTDPSMKVQSNSSVGKVADAKAMPAGKGSSKIDQEVSKGSAKSATRKSLERQTPSKSASKSRSGMDSRAGEGREKQSAMARPSSKTSSARSAVASSSSQLDSVRQESGRGERSHQGKQSSTARQSSAGGGGKSKPQGDAQGRRSAAGRPPSAAERPPSAGITTLPSKELQEITRMHPGLKHQQGYQEGLGSFFMGGVDVKDNEDTNKRDMETVRTHTPTNVLPECSYKGPSTWRPDSSMSNHPDHPANILSPSPPKQAKDAKSSGRKRSSVPKATGIASSGTPIKGDTTSSAPGNRSTTTSATPRAMSSKPRNSGAAGRTPRTSAGVTPAKAGSWDVDNTLHWRLSQAEKMKGSGVAQNGPRKMATGDHSASSSASTIPPRSSSRIEVDGDDMTGYDDDGEVRRREEEDHEALEQLTWELASNEGRITADGRISSFSLIEGFDENLLLMGEEEQDRALGITQDDGLGSGLSTPCNDLSLDQFSEEELRSDFEVAADNQRSKDEVQALNS